MRYVTLYVEISTDESDDAARARLLTAARTIPGVTHAQVTEGPTTTRQESPDVS